MVAERRGGLADAPSIRALKRRVAAFGASLPAGDGTRLRCVILFGSRARDDYSSLSDWDICALWDGVPPRGDRPDEHEGRPVDWHDFDTARFRDDANRISALPRTISELGIVLAGEPCGHSPEPLAMNHADWVDQFDRILAAAMRVAAGASRIGFDMRLPFRPLIGGSADLAELVVKCVFYLRGVTPRSTHRMDKLADQWASSRLWPNESKGSPPPPGGPAYADRIRALNGDAYDDHNVAYALIDEQYGPDANAQALLRASGALRLLRDALDDPSLGGKGIRKESLAEPKLDVVIRRARASHHAWMHDVVAPLRQAAADDSIPFDAKPMLEAAENIAARALAMATEIEAQVDTSAARPDGAPAET